MPTWHLPITALGTAATLLLAAVVTAGALRRRLIAAMNPSLAPRRRPPRPAGPAVRSPGDDVRAGGKNSPSRFESVAEAIRQMSIDMDAISGNSRAAQLAIGNVAAALQALTGSLDAMARDSAEELGVARNPENAARHTATNVERLAAAALEMETVVSRVRQLAQGTGEFAAQIEGGAGTIRPAIAEAVMDLAQQADDATRDIAATIAAMLPKVERCQAAIAVVSHNVAAINDIGRHLEPLALEPIGLSAAEAAPSAPAAVAPGVQAGVVPAVTPPADSVVAPAAVDADFGDVFVFGEPEPEPDRAGPVSPAPAGGGSGPGEAAMPLVSRTEQAAGVPAAAEAARQPDSGVPVQAAASTLAGPNVYGLAIAPAEAFTPAVPVAGKGKATKPRAAPAGVGA